MTNSDYKEIKNQTHTQTKPEQQKTQKHICGEVQGVIKGKAKQEEKQVKWANGCNAKLTSYIILTEAHYLNPVHSTTRKPSICQPMKHSTHSI